MKCINVILKCIFALHIGLKLVVSMSPSYSIRYSTDTSIGDIADYIASKGYIPDDKELPRTPLIKNNDKSSTYILSKLSDEELLKLLTEQPLKNEYNLNDIMRIAFNAKPGRENKFMPQNAKISADSSMERNRFHPVTNNKQPAYFRLDNKKVDQNKGQNVANYIALQELKKLLNIHSQSKTEENINANDDKKQMIFDILVAQLKTLCCQDSKKPNKDQYETLINEILPSLLNEKYNFNGVSTGIDLVNKFNEFMFLIINDDIISNGSNELIDVDPESLDRNSTILLLGPVTTQLSAEQLKLVMNRISKELLKPEYMSFLQQLSDGKFNDTNKNVVKNFIFGPKTRRYIKPHRCNHQSKLAKVYGGPKWIVCTGYLNLNKPSLYD